MKFLSIYLVAPATLAALSFLAGCGSDNSGDGNPAGGASGKAGSAGSSAAGASGAAVTAGSAGIAGSAGGGSSAAGSGSGGTNSAGAGGGVAVAATFATVKGIISMTCFGNGCHSQEGNPLQMDVSDSAKLYATLTTHVTKTCGKMVNTASPAESGIVKLLTASCNGTPRMPFQMCFDGDVDPPCVSAENIAAIQAWIAKGAPQQ